ncbi:MAG: hypothetical protein JNN03_23520 [Rubrivivax sp.]|nr:hypothetical protein [Rubrivivax sp.]
MLRKALTLWLAALLLWTSVSTAEPWLAVLDQGVPACLGEDAAGAPALPLAAGGTVADHHLDDLPSPAPGDGTSDQPALPARVAEARQASSARLRPEPPTGGLHAAPVLQGPRRPPRQVGHFA